MFDLNSVIRKLIESRDDDLCVCMSGKLFKDCHKLIIQKNKENTKKLFYELLKIRNKKECLFGKGYDCEGNIIKAHSISEKYLWNIVDKDNHVYSFIRCINNMTLLKELNSNGILPDPERIGIHDVTTFYGLCEKHDNDLFSCFEKYAFVCSIEQIKALHLRAVLKEIYVKTESILTINKSQKCIGKVSNGNIAFNKNILATIMSLGSNLSLRDLYIEAGLIIDCIKDTSGEKYFYACYEIEGKCPILCSSIPNPAYNFYGEKIQNYNDESIFMRSFSFNILSDSDKYYFIFSWFDCVEMDSFFQSFLDRYKTDTLQALIQMAFAFSENIAICINWFDSLSLIRKERLKKIFFSNILNLSGDKTTSEEFRKLKFVDGKIIRLISNAPYFA